MRNQHVIYHKQIHKHYSHARTLTIILLQILKHSFKIPYFQILSCQHCHVAPRFHRLHPGHVDSCHDEVDADVRQEGSDAMTTVPQVNFISYPLLTCERKYK